FDQRAGVVFAPCATVRADVAAERLLAPGAVERADDRREGTGRLEAARVAQGDSQRAVAAHRVAGDALARHVGRELGRNQLGEFLLDIGAHAEVLRPRLLRRIDVEARAFAEIVAFLHGNRGPARAGR